VKKSLKSRRKGAEKRVVGERKIDALGSE